MEPCLQLAIVPLRGLRGARCWRWIRSPRGGAELNLAPILAAAMSGFAPYQRTSSAWRGTSEKCQEETPPYCRCFAKRIVLYFRVRFG